MSLIAVKSTPDYAAALFLEDEHFLGGCSVNRYKLLALYHFYFPVNFSEQFQNMIKSNQQQAPCPKEQGEKNVITSLRKFIAYKHKNQNMEKDDF